jgi:prepilin-type N-terminal cleavage/methylation domain-containing protein
MRIDCLPPASRHDRQRGFSLFEVLVSLSIVQIFVYTGRSTVVAREITLGGILAAQKLEQLRSLTFLYDEGGAPVGDEMADLAFDPERASGGAGLGVSPADALTRNVMGYCDFLDGRGGSLGGGTAAPSGTAFVRRWLVQPLEAAPAQGLVIQVRLTSLVAARRGGAGAADVTLTTVRSRLAR